MCCLFSKRQLVIVVRGSFALFSKGKYIGKFFFLPLKKIFFLVYRDACHFHFFK